MNNCDYLADAHNVLGQRPEVVLCQKNCQGIRQPLPIFIRDWPFFL